METFAIVVVNLVLIGGDFTRGDGTGGNVFLKKYPRSKDHCREKHLWKQVQ